jgi:hypothetical protein
LAAIEKDVLKQFEEFVAKERYSARGDRTQREQNEAKITDLQNFAASFKLPTQIPIDIISIVANDPAKQRLI